MARSSARPGRTVTVFFVCLAIAYGLVALVGTWKPALGLDLEGGTQIVLTAKGSPASSDLKQAADIINNRVNGSGVSEATVTTQGNNEIVVEVPGTTKNGLVQTVERQAQLYFRLVGKMGPGTATTPAPSASPSGSPSASPSPGAGVTLPSSPQTKKPTHHRAQHGSKSQSSSSGANRTPALLGKDHHSKGPKATASPSATPTPSPSGPTSTSQVNYTAANKKSFQDPLTWMANPDPQSLQVFDNYTCPASKPVVDNPDLPLVTCDAQGNKYLLSPAPIRGTEVTSASAGIPQNQVQWVVNLQLDNAGANEQLKLSQAMAGDQSKLFAITLDGKVISAPYFQSVIANGSSQITGNFTEAEAKSLATSLNYGALPIAFDKSKMTIQTIGPSLAGDQLKAGITAGIVGLLLVMIYCLLYYRGLGIVVISSLIVAGATTYALVLLLAKSAGFTLTLPGIAGLIVAVGITADSFIVFFERIRDEMRSGKSMRVAVEAGWIRARATCLAADSVSILAALVLYVFAAGVVKGFAFALGLSTIIDLVVFFWFTHPMVSWLARFQFFNRGHRLSGLNAETLGIDRLPAGGRA
jgi:preprotein translocase subunit SecD